ncbi:hypothetical protein LCGC14_0381410 [marine sediment metagenome]|uniref:Uncharacterized protein n=1 Tax=marine sediment metagenome TaxID=412755 RepID=A0A0F9TKJ8_9ZZZZ
MKTIEKARACHGFARNDPSTSENWKLANIVGSQLLECRHDHRTEIRQGHLEEDAERTSRAHLPRTNDLAHGPVLSTLRQCAVCGAALSVCACRTVSMF